MSHVDEGMLHAYLDGALDSFPAVQAEQVRRHLAECDECRARMEEEQAVRDEAAAVLGGAFLEVGDMPSFEELRTRARTSRAAGTPSRMQRLAWAATVVLALGTGWLLRGGLSRPGGSIDALEDRADQAAPAPVAKMGAADGVEATRVDDAPTSVAPAGVEGVPPPARSSGTAATQGASAPDAAVDRDVRMAEVEVADVAAGDSAAPPDAAKAADLWAAARERRDQERPAQRAIPLPSAAVDPLVDPRALEPRPEQARRAVNLAGSGASLRGEAVTVAGASLVVPGLAVVSVTWLDEPGLAGAVRVLQLTEGGDTLELVHLPAGVDPSLLPAQGDGRTQVLSPRDGGWLVLRGRTSAEVLSGLLRRLGGGD